MPDRTANDAALEALRLLAVYDPDWAGKRNAVGFNQCDTRIGHWLASLEAIPERLVPLAVKLALRYKRQLPEELVRELEEHAASLPTPGPGARGVLAVVDGENRLSLSTPYDAAFVEELKTAPYEARRWDPAARQWVVDPVPAAARAVRRAFQATGWEVPPEAAAWIELVESLPPVHLDPGSGSIAVYTDSRETSEELGIDRIPGAAWDKDARAWRIPAAAPSLRRLRDALKKAGIPAPAWFDALLHRAEEEAASSASLSRATGLEEEVAREIEELRLRLRSVLPAGLELYPYQVAGVAFIEHAGGKALLADEMGLGKTVQALAWLALHPDVRPVVVFCPGMVRVHWARDAMKWLPGDTAEVVVAKDDVRRLCSRGLRAVAEPSGEASIVIVNYEAAARHADRLVALRPAGVVLDECQYIKEQSAQRTKAAVRVAKAARHVVALSGTPIVNRPAEFFTALNLLRPDMFPSWWKYAKRYCGLHHNGYGWDYSGATNTRELAEILRTQRIMIRRRKEDVLTDLPPKRRVGLDLECEDGGEIEDAVREALRELCSAEGRRWLESGGQAPGGVLASLSRLRHALGLAKVRAALPWLVDAAQQAPIVVFTHHEDAALAVRKGLREAGLRAEAVTGSRGAAERQAAVDAFQSGQLDALVLTYGAGGVGITLTRASDVVLLEREWVPAVEEQAEDRLHRIGQRSSVTVWVAVTDHEVDRTLHRVCESKRAVIGAVLGDGAARGREEASVLREFAAGLAAMGDVIE